VPHESTVGRLIDVLCVQTDALREAPQPVRALPENFVER
jgi:hypothetical protein